MKKETADEGFSVHKKNLLESLLFQPGVVLMFGASDTGKTTLARELAASTSRRAKTALIDLDVGQSSVGPPACIGACLVQGTLSPWTWAEKMHFVGNFSPRGHFLQMLHGLVRLIRWAKSKEAVHIFVDTTGFITGGAALELKYHKVELSRPSHLVFLERKDELAALRKIFHNREGMLTYRIEVPETIPRTDPDERRKWRLNRLSSYLKKTHQLVFPMTDSVFLNPFTWQEANDRGDLVLRMVGCMDGEGDTLALGVIQEVDHVRGRLLIRTPLRSARGVARLRLGRVRYI